MSRKRCIIQNSPRASKKGHKFDKANSSESIKLCWAGEEEWMWGGGSKIEENRKKNILKENTTSLT